MSKHTDGPWCVKETPMQDYQIWSMGGECIAVDVISKENTKLIAAAPEMLEILKMFDTIDTSDNYHHWDELSEKVTAILQSLYVRDKP